jgi:hypothetical protein
MNWNKFTLNFPIPSPENTRFMKKIFLIVSLLLAFAGFSFAQAPPAAPAKTKTATTATPAKATTATTPAKTTTATTPAKTASTTAGPLKKDGTPDMRYKANKDAGKPAGPLKKDGTPDMRYKANKDAAKTTATATTPKTKTPATPKKTN